MKKYIDDKYNAISKLNYHEKRVFLINACLIYKKIKKSKKLLETKIKYSDNFKNLKQKTNQILNIETTSFFDIAFSLLNKDLKLIIKEDFIEKNCEPTWYLNYWSKTQYYKLKHKAMNEMLFLIYV